MPTLNPQDQDFIASLSSSFATDAGDRQRLHDLIDRLPSGVKALLVVQCEATVAFEGFGETGPTDAVYMCQAVTHKIFAP